jgi:hypothetical protein
LALEKTNNLVRSVAPVQALAKPFAVAADSTPTHIRLSWIFTAPLQLAARGKRPGGDRESATGFEPWPRANHYVAQTAQYGN